MDLIFLIRHKKRSIECVMDLSCFGETKLVGDQRENFDDSEGSFLFWAEFGVGNGSL